MRVSHEWLASMVELDGVPEQEVVRRLTVSGTEVERTIPFAQGLADVLVGEVVDLRRVERSDHLFLARVRSGGEEPLEVVCGAPNLFVGALVPWARPGTKLPSGTEIGRRRIRGVESQGMLCAPDELQLGSDHEGILILSADDAEPGQPLGEIFAADTVYELEILSNRADCLSHWGVARELAAILDRSLQSPDTSPVTRVGPPLANSVSVTIDDPDLCPVYWADGYCDIPHRPAPLWIRRRLMAVGQRSRGGAVDLANYVLLEMGQPLHTFDWDRIRQPDGQTSLVVRRARRGEEMAGLDGQDWRLDDGTLVISANGRPSAIAGVMGGRESAVIPSTTNLLVESASFQWTSIRGTSRRLGLRTEASARFERVLAPHLVPVGASRFARLMHDALGVAGLPGPVVAGSMPVAQGPIRIAADQVSSLLGMRVELARTAAILRRLEFQVAEEEGDLLATPPAVRTDLRAPVDIVEEVGRIAGYDLLPATLPALRQPPPVLAGEAVARMAGEIAMGAGFTECITLSLGDPTRPGPVGGLGEDRVHILIGNPLSVPLGSLRTGLLPGLLTACHLNQTRGRERVRLFEQGRVFWAAGGGEKPLEPELLALVDQAVDGNAEESAHRLRHLLRVSQALGDRLSVRSTEFRMRARQGFHPARCAEVVADGIVQGVVGELDRTSTDLLELRGRVVVAELRTDGWLVPGGRPSVAPELARTPSLLLDLAVTVPLRSELGTALAAVRSSGLAELEEVLVLDEYHGPQLEAGVKGWTFRLVFRDPARTLTNRQGDQLRVRVMEILHAAVGAGLR